MAAYLHGVRITLDGITFSFVVNIGYGLRDLFLGVRVEKISDVNVLLPVMYTCRKNITKSDPFLTGEAVFCADYVHTQDNYFNTSESFGLGFISMVAEDRSEMIIKIVQDSLLLVELYRLTREEGEVGKKKVKDLRLWKHLAMGMIESLASNLGYRSIRARNHYRFKHLYADLFSTRLGLDDKPAYHLKNTDIVGRPSFWVSNPRVII